MKTRAFFVALACLVVGFCTTSLNERIWLKEPYSEEYIKSTTKPIGQQTLTISELSYDQVWDACERTLIRLGFGFYKADKTDGEMRVRGSDLADGSEPYKISIIISRTDAQVAIQVGCLYGAKGEPLPSELNLAKNEVTRVVQELKKELSQ